MIEASDIVSSLVVAYILRPAYVLPVERGVVVLQPESTETNGGPKKLPF